MVNGTDRFGGQKDITISDFVPSTCLSCSARGRPGSGEAGIWAIWGSVGLTTALRGVCDVVIYRISGRSHVLNGRPVPLGSQKEVLSASRPRSIVAWETQSVVIIGVLVVLRVV